MRALVKLEQVLPAHLRRRVAALGSATIAPPVAGPTVDPEHLTVIAAACRDLERLRFAYRAATARRRRREVEPHTRSSTSAAAGTWWRGTAARGLAHVPRRPGLSARRERACGSRRARVAGEDAAAYVAEEHPTGRTASRRA